MTVIARIYVEKTIEIWYTVFIEVCKKFIENSDD